MAGDRVARKRQRVSHDDEDAKKTRGRPRVEGADETAADVCGIPHCHAMLFGS